MAIHLKNKHELLALKVSLTRQRRETSVRMELEMNKGGVPSVLLDHTLSASEMGLPRNLEARQFPYFQLPPSLTDEIARLIGKLDLEPSHPLWLHLVSPYGYLGVVPWEQLLVPVLNRPLLRLPDFLEPQRERKSVLDVALLCSVPISEPSFHPPTVVREMSASILAASPRPQTTVHVFADKEYFDEISNGLASESRIVVHNPDEAERYGIATTSATVPEDAIAVTCPWLRWISAAMRGRSLDTVHFLCHGYLANEQPALSVAESPISNRDRWMAHVLSVREVVAFLNQTGAWSVAFSAPPNNYSESGLRLFADTFAQTRPGPVLYHDASADFTLDGLRAAYQFLYAPEPSEPPPRAPMFIYCQPALVDTQRPVVRQMQSSRLESVLSQNADIFAEPDTSDAGRRKRAASVARGEAEVSDVPNWVAAAQRYVENAAFSLQRRDTSTERSRTSRNARSADVAEQTLSDAQEIIGRYARESMDAANEDELPA